jgi:hypothetical protein
MCWANGQVAISEVDITCREIREYTVLSAKQQQQQHKQAFNEQKQAADNWKSSPAGSVQLAQVELLLDRPLAVVDRGVDDAAHCASKDRQTT